MECPICHVQYFGDDNGLLLHQPKDGHAEEGCWACLNQKYPEQYPLPRAA